MKKKSKVIEKTNFVSLQENYFFKKEIKYK